MSAGADDELAPPGRRAPRDERTRVGPIRARRAASGSAAPGEGAEAARSAHASGDWSRREAEFGAPEESGREPRSRGRRRWLRFGLPLLAFAVLGAIFMGSRPNFTDNSLPTAEEIGIALGNELTAPSFTGSTEDGAPYLVYAERAKPDGLNPTRIDLEKINGELKLPDRVLALSSGSGVYRPKDGDFVLEDGVRVSTSDGYALTGDKMIADLKSKRVESVGPVQAESPEGELQAGAMTVEAGSAEAGGLVVLFEGGVRLRLRPGTRAVARPARE